MTTAICIVLALVILAELWFLALQCRKNHPALKMLSSFRYAHRGLHDKPAIPENSMAAFRRALDNFCGAELDVHLMADGNLAVIHDCSLKRTAGADVNITDLTVEDLEQYRLEGTEEKIPTFDQVLKLYDGKAPLIIELKADGNNHAALVEAAVKAMEGYNGTWCMESFDPRCVNWLRKHRPDIIRGQLSADFLKTGKNMPLWQRIVMTHNMSHCLTNPDFIAYQFEHRHHTLGNYFSRKVWGILGVSWTIRTKKDYDLAVKEGWIPIFENFIP